MRSFVLPIATQLPLAYIKDVLTYWAIVAFVVNAEYI